MKNISEVFEGLDLHYVDDQVVYCTIGKSKGRLPEDAFLVWGQKRLAAMLLLQGNLPFILGSFCNQMRRRSQKWEQILPDVKSMGGERKLKTLVNYASIMDKYTPDQLAWKLTFSHYRVVAYVQPVSLRQELLQRAWDQNLSVEELNELKPKTGEPDDDPDDFDDDNDSGPMISLASAERFGRALVDLLPTPTLVQLIDDMRHMIQDREALALVSYLEIQLRERETVAI